MASPVPSSCSVGSTVASETGSSVADPTGTPGTDFVRHDLVDAKSLMAYDLLLKNLYDDLFDESHAAKIWRVANSFLERPEGLSEFPEFVPTTGSNAGHYVGKPFKFWTCGFFPGSMYAILERLIRYPEAVCGSTVSRDHLRERLLDLCRTWIAPLRENSLRTDTHDMGFILLPALRKDWELTSNQSSLDSICTGARNLASRYSEKTGAIRSWNQTMSNSYCIKDMEKNFLIIIDSMCNMDLLFYAAHHSGDKSLAEKATSHAKVARRTLIRPDGSTYHVANLNPQNGNVQHTQTHQGYSDSSCWARGQAWGILGFTQTYMWTKDTLFLETAIRLAIHFLSRLSQSTYPCPCVPLWDFDAPPSAEFPEGLRDTSAGLIAANGLLLLHQALQGQSPYLRAALDIVRDTCIYSLSRDRASFISGADGEIKSSEGHWDAILMHSTVNHNENALVRYGDHGLVYADYFFLEFGNKLLRMGFV